ncbi:ABC transporter ATP-binding protein [Caryophanon tenue]|uniref:ABC transporter domain-containing protein n=1 Tax=Caryophanon tenue TaxID=33978 RepID=A0A1C0YC38_9BACL|nr:ABC transporter ATP-binding protein [Caryophanon tenue]OCS84705.1 hypothetical protein A6M13_03775 [Caryophanon tenue]
MADVKLVNISKDYDQKVRKKKQPTKKAVEDINFVIPSGSFTVIVGPSGCGKSTTLRMIAGLEAVTEGEVWIGDRIVNDVKPGDRNIAMVFQNYALYPTMTVYKNISFGLENIGVPKKEIDARVQQVATLVNLSAYLDRKPHQLSGGQRQRVALARAIVKRPDLYIFDEPLSNLDAKLRAEMRNELINMHKELQTTFIYVTHDQVEAMSMADQIILLNEGNVMQIGSPMELYHRPQNIFVATFMGTPAMNILPVTEVISLVHQTVKPGESIGYRPEKARLSEQPNDDFFWVKSEIVTTELLGSETLYRVKNKFGEQHVKLTEPFISTARDVYVFVKHEDLYFFDENGERLEGVNTHEHHQQYALR